MKNVLATITKIIFAVFSIAVLGLLMSLTYQALQRIFPASFANQMWGLVLFDIAAICWALVFVYACQTVLQYAVAAIGFIAGFLGTLGMVAAEVMLSGQNLVTADQAQIGQWLVYGFIGATALHAALLYGHHAGAPRIAEQVEIGIARGQVVDAARKQATKRIEEEQRMLADSIAEGLVAQIKRDLNLPIPADPRMPFLPAEPKRYEQKTLPLPVLKDEPTSAQVPFPESKDSSTGGSGTVQS